MGVRAMYTCESGMIDDVHLSIVPLLIRFDVSDACWVRPISGYTNGENIKTEKTVSP